MVYITLHIAITHVFCLLHEQSSLLGWAPTPCVPNCIISHLASIQFKGFQGSPDEVSFVEYVLQNGLVLKTMIIAGISLDLNKKYEILKKLSDLPRASGMCRLKFDWTVSPYYICIRCELTHNPYFCLVLHEIKDEWSWV